MKALVTLLILALALPVAAAPLTRDGALPVRILFDNSGSMYPGYLPPGTPDRRTREELGVHYIHELPSFARWLDQFVQQQSVIGGSTAGMWTFTSNGQFTPADIAEVHPVVPIRDFRAADALSHVPPHAGNRTYLTETLNAFTRNFTGLVWLITDNIVETNAGEPDAGVQQFFESLARQEEYRSVHLFKYVCEENGHAATLAIYGILVSSQPVSSDVLASYDNRFRELGDGNLFPAHEHLKLKNLSIEPMRLRADLQLVLADREKGTFKEGDEVRLALDGEIRSYLTQHAVTAGRYELRIGEPFVPEEWAQRDIGAVPLAAEVFDSVSGTIDQAIPPNGTRRLEALLHSQQPVSFKPKGPIEWLRLAWNGAAVHYTGAVTMSFTDIRVRFERQRMAGIFGIDHAAPIFEFQNVATIPNVEPSLAPVSFALNTGTSRTAILLLLLALLIAVAGVAAFLLSRKQLFRINIGGTAQVLSLRRLGGGNVMDEGKLLGRLSRGVGNGYAFHPVTSQEITVVPAGDGSVWDVKVKGGVTRRLTIKADGGGVAKAPPQKPNQPAARGAPPPPPSLKPPMPPGRPPGKR